MARANIAKLLEQRGNDAPAAPAPEASPIEDAPPASKSSTSSSSRSLTRPTAGSVRAAEGDPSRQLYKKGAVLYMDQLEALDAHARRLNQAKSSTELPRITANTLLRIAADMLLARADRISGDDEKQLRKALGL